MYYEHVFFFKNLNQVFTCMLTGHFHEPIELYLKSESELLWVFSSTQQYKKQQYSLTANLRSTDLELETLLSRLRQLASELSASAAQRIPAARWHSRVKTG